MIIGLVKIFEKQKFATAFRHGEIYAQRLSYFRGLKSRERGDEYEGVILLQPDRGTLTLSYGRENLTVPPCDLAGPIELTLDRVNNLNIFCMFALHCKKSENLTVEDVNALRKQFEIPSTLTRGLGEYAVVITNVTEFFRRVQEASISKGFLGKRGLVQYYDPDQHHTTNGGAMDLPLLKRNVYAHHKEYRFIFDTHTTGLHAITLKVGDLRDISTCVKTEDFNSLLEIKFGEGE